MVHHHLQFTDYDAETPGVRVIMGQCSCSAWFEVKFDPGAKQLLVSARFNNYPPCPAVGVARVFEEELMYA